MAKKNIAKVLKELKDIKKETSSIEEDPDLQELAPLLISKDYEELNTASKILSTYLKVLVSILPLVEQECKRKATTWSVSALTGLGDSIRQTIIELEIYKDPEEIIQEHIAPNIQFHHDRVIKTIAEQLSRAQNHLLELVPEDKKHQAKRILVSFLKTLGEDLREVYEQTSEEIRENLVNVRGL